MQNNKNTLIQKNICFLVFYTLGFAFYNLQFAMPPAIGWVEIAGYSTRDRQVYGPALLRIYNDPFWGIHLVWKDEPSRVLYNFKDRRTGYFRWSGGTNVFTERVNLGNLDIDPRSHCIQIVANFFDNNQYVPVYAADSAPGQGNFKEYVQPRGYKWNVLAVTNYSYTRFFCQKEDTLYYRSTYDGRKIGYFGPFPTHNITAAHDTSKIAIIWTGTSNAYEGIMFIRDSRNGGVWWFDTLAVSRTIPSVFKNTFLGGYGLYDLQRKLHIVANVYDGSNPYQVELWHCWKDTNTIMVWSRICSTGTNHPIPIGDYALYAGRPSISQNPRTGDLFVCWEQFDSLNYEPLTGLARAEIWASRSNDNGLTWGQPICLTIPDNTSKRFPSLAPVVNDTLHITYMVDSIAGFWEQNQGRKTTNLIIYHRVLADLIPVGINENEGEKTIPSEKPSFAIYPNPFSKTTVIQIPNSKLQRFEICIYNAIGKLVTSHQSQVASRYFIWDGLDNNRKLVRPGIYFCELVLGEQKEIKKFVLVR
jgi:hypothetical protein